MSGFPGTMGSLSFGHPKRRRMNPSIIKRDTEESPIKRYSESNDPEEKKKIYLAEKAAHEAEMRASRLHIC